MWATGTRKRRKTDTVAKFVEGSLPVVKTGQAAGRVAHVLSCNVQLDSAEISKSVDLLPWFVLGNAEKPCCWHVGRVHHCCRMLIATEASVERLGSVLHGQFSSVQHLAPAQVVDRLILRQAGVAMLGLLGSARDDFLKEAACRSMTATRMRVRGGRSTLQISAKLQLMAESGRTFQCFDGHSMEPKLNSSTDYLCHAYFYFQDVGPPATP